MGFYGICRQNQVCILLEKHSRSMARIISLRNYLLSIIIVSHLIHNSNLDVIKMVINRCLDQLAPESETRLYLEDIHDHVLTMTQNLIHYEKTLARSHSNYLAHISIELTQASNRTSDVVVKMTALASILVPLNVVTGLWGMNVKVPGQDREDLNWFIGILFFMV